MIDSSSDSGTTETEDTGDTPVMEDGTLTGTDGVVMQDLAGFEGVKQVIAEGGDDVVTPPADDTLLAETEIYGGGGDDLFDVTISYGNLHIPTGSSDGAQEVASIGDFNGEQDSLVINLQRDSEYSDGPVNEDTTYTGLSVEEGGTVDDPTAAVILNFVNAGGDPFDVIIALEGGPFPAASDITVNL
ncbi:hypothetical protein [Neptunicoccus cionae]|uniref:Uncharacterized protein n=1 Tax=Neptunicoccus cionae TaxID=2035344 RepID=A0A916VTF9_9RHOB|nr:hypothetical protein [Amylibacter cionae]GGA31575.1 hypothetical protein GCM10011498_36030 [Amylibacter cionae]